MSKAEKFISDCTRNCSNELCAVEDRFEKKVISYHEWLTPDQARRAVEIAREETVEEVCKLLKNNIAEYILPNKGLDLDWFIEDLKQAMKDE